MRKKILIERIKIERLPLESHYYVMGSDVWWLAKVAEKVNEIIDIVNKNNK